MYLSVLGEPRSSHRPKADRIVLSFAYSEWETTEHQSAKYTGLTRALDSISHCQGFECH